MRSRCFFFMILIFDSLDIRKSLIRAGLKREKVRTDEDVFGTQDKLRQKSGISLPISSFMIFPVDNRFIRRTFYDCKIFSAAICASCTQSPMPMPL